MWTFDDQFRLIAVTAIQFIFNMSREVTSVVGAMSHYFFQYGILPSVTYFVNQTDFHYVGYTILGPALVVVVKEEAAAATTAPIKREGIDLVNNQGSGTQQSGEYSHRRGGEMSMQEIEKIAKHHERIQSLLNFLSKEGWSAQECSDVLRSVSHQIDFELRNSGPKSSDC